MPETVMPVRRRARRWRRFLACWALGLLLVGAAGCVVLYRYAAAYEASLPEPVMDAWMAANTEEDWARYARQGADLTVSEFEDGEALFAAWYQAARERAPFTYRKDPAEFTAERPVYTVRAGGAAVCTVVLKPEGVNAAGFGRQRWTVGEIHAAFSMASLPSVAVEVDAPQTQAVYLNGKPLGAAQRLPEPVPCPELTALESRFDPQPSYIRYRVDALYGSVEVTDGQGRRLAPMGDAADGTVRYTLPPETRYGFTVHAPETVTVSVCGAELTETDAAETDDGILAGLEEYTGGAACRTRTYTAQGLYSQPVFSARGRNGAALTPLVNEKGELFFFEASDPSLEAAVSARVETFFQRYIAYSSQAYDAGRCQALLNCILPGTALYDYIRDSRAAMLWASETTVRYDELTFADFCPVGERCFTCTIRYQADFDATAWYESYSYDLYNAYELAFVERDGEWYAAAMSVVAG